MNRIAKLWWTAKGVGWDNLPRRLLQAWRERTSSLRKRLDPSQFTDEAFRAQCSVPVGEQPAGWARRAGRFFAAPPAEALRAAADDPTWQRQVTDVCERALAGEYLFFSRWYASLGWPPNFNLDGVHGDEWPVGEHWLSQGHSSAARHDIKLVWEPSRLSLGYFFARAYARTGEQRWAEGFWQMFDAWVEQCPPEQAPAWRCGQEMSFRLMAMLFGAAATLGSRAAAPPRLHALSRLAWQTAKHIAVNINQARMQGNNHAVSEAVGLWTVGLLFPEFASADEWRRRGLEVLSAEVARQIADDGSYVQNSLNYHRVMLDDLLWAHRLADMNGCALPAAVRDRFRRATDWLVEMIDPASGGAPNYGANDGALVLPLSTCDFADFRPVAQAASCVAHGTRCFAPGPWDEKVLWLLGPDSPSAAVAQPGRSPSFASSDGGYYVLRGPDSWAMTRCHTYRSRPNQADMLHVDLWCRGVNVLRDAGSYTYHGDPPWQDYFPGTAAHNTVKIDGEDQMVRGPRFLWFKWTRSRVLRFETSPDGRVGVFQGEHDAYRRLPGRIVHRRTVCRIDDTYVIVDDLTGSGEHEVALRWRLCGPEWKPEGNSWQTEVAGGAIRATIAVPQPMTHRMSQGQENPPEGWESRYYGEKTAAPTLLVSGPLLLPASILTVVGPADCSIEPAASGVAPDQPNLLSGPEDPELWATVCHLSGGRLRHE